MAKAVLCYVDGGRAYFTTQPLEAQWGDDWNDAPYEHNAGSPYPPYKPEDAGKWEIRTLIFESDLQTPASTASGNSGYSVQDINRKVVPWLVDRYGKSGVAIFAGMTERQFIRAIYKAGGKVYKPLRRAALTTEASR